MRKLPSLLLVAATLLAGVSPLAAQQKRVSPHESIYGRVGSQRNGALVSITYGRPFSTKPGTAEARKVWGGLVPWGEPYRLGADEATLLLTQVPLVFGETTIAPGAYTLYMVPTETGASQLVISSAIGKWGIPVDVTHDLVRVDLKKESLDKNVDQLTLAIDNAPDAGGGVVRIMWETTQYSVPFTVKK